MLATLAESADAAGTLVFEFALASDGRLAEELRDRAATVHPLGNVRLSRPASVLRARQRFRALLRERGYAAVICHAPWSHAIFAALGTPSGAACVSVAARSRRAADRLSNGRREASAPISSSATAGGPRKQRPSCNPLRRHRVIYCAVATPSAIAGRAQPRSRRARRKPPATSWCCRRAGSNPGRAIWI